MATTAFPSRDDFAALLNESLGGENETFEGKVVKGIVTGIENDLAVIDVGLKSEGRVALREFACAIVVVPDLYSPGPLVEIEEEEPVTGAGPTFEICLEPPTAPGVYRAVHQMKSGLDPRDREVPRKESGGRATPCLL
mgnify:CR=1 FL=1